MKKFLVELEYESRKYECFVQKLKCAHEDLYILHLKDTNLIRRFLGKKMVFYCPRTSVKDRNPAYQMGESRDSVFEDKAWNAIRHKDPYHLDNHKKTVFF